MSSIQLEMRVTPKPNVALVDLCPGQIYTVFDIDEDEQTVFIREKFAIPGIPISDLLQVIIDEDGNKIYKDLI